jgi:phospholipase C
VNLGQRIPLLLISSYAKEGYVDNYTTSGYSILAFIDWNWGLPYLKPIVKEFGYQGVLGAFNFSSPRAPLPLTPENWAYPVPLQYSIRYGYVATINNNYTAYQELYQHMKMGNYSLPSQFTEGNVNLMGPTVQGSGYNSTIIYVSLVVVIVVAAAFILRRK